MKPKVIEWLNEGMDLPLPEPEERADDAPAPEGGEISMEDDISPEGEADVEGTPAPEEELELLNFDDFISEYIERSATDSPADLFDKLGDLEGILELGGREKKFLTDNLQILSLREDHDVMSLSKSAHRLEDPLDMMAQICTTMEKNPAIASVPHKLTSFFGMKPDLYRKFIAACIGGVQVGSGGTAEDLIVAPTKGQKLAISTRFYTDFGFIDLIPWDFKEGDPQAYLKEIELERLRKGAPDEKLVLLKRVIMSSIVGKLGPRTFFIGICNRTTGDRFDCAIRMDKFLMDGYSSGLFSVEFQESEEAMISGEGSITQPSKITIMFNHPTGEPKTLLTQDAGLLTINLLEEDLITALDSVGFSYYKKTRYEGTAEELETQQKCIPSLSDLLLRRC